MAFVGGVFETFVVENVSYVPSTRRATDLRALHSHASIVMQRESPINGLVERRPAATRVEFGLRFVKRGLTACTLIYTRFEELVVFSYQLYMRRKEGEGQKGGMEGRKEGKEKGRYHCLAFRCLSGATRGTARG